MNSVGPSPRPKAFRQEVNSSSSISGYRLPLRPVAVGAEWFDGQGQPRRAVAQFLAPVGGGVLQQLSSEPPPLGPSEIGILDRRWREGIGLPFQGGVVERGQLPQEDAARPPVEDEVVRGDQQDMLGGREPEEREADRRTMDQVEGSAAFRFTGPLDTLEAILAARRGDVASDDHHGRGRLNDLDGMTVDLAEGSSEDLVSPHDFHQGVLQDVHPEVPIEVESQRLVVNSRSRSNLLENPNLLLRQR